MSGQVARRTSFHPTSVHIQSCDAKMFNLTHVYIYRWWDVQISTSHVYLLTRGVPYKFRNRRVHSQEFDTEQISIRHLSIWTSGRMYKLSPHTWPYSHTVSCTAVISHVTLFACGDRDINSYYRCHILWACGRMYI